jgi:hypothetical protein
MLRGAAVDKFFFYKSYFDVKDSFPEEDMQWEYLKAVVTFGVTGTYQIENPIVKAVFVNVKEQIMHAKKQNAINTAIGKKGGRPRQVDRSMVKAFSEQGYSVKEIAEVMQCSVRTVQRALQFKIYDMEEERLVAERKTKYKPIRWQRAEEIKQGKQEENASGNNGDYYTWF